jgi:hypothetical protein
MDVSQYKDYVLFLLFIKYITDKYGSSTDFAPPFTTPPGRHQLALEARIEDAEWRSILVVPIWVHPSGDTRP